MERHYTLENAAEKTLYIHRLNKGAGTINSEISLHHLYNRLVSGQTLVDIRRDFPKMQRSRLLLARSFFFALNPELYQKRHVSSLKVLVDENVDEHFVTDAARRAFGHATHVAFEGLADDKDLNLWKHAVKNQYNLIVTKDRATISSRETLDMTLCAEHSWRYRLKGYNWMVTPFLEKLPRLLHVMDGSLNGIEVSKRIATHKNQIIEAFEECSSPVIQLHENGVKPGKNILELIEQGQFERVRAQRDKLVADLLSEYGLDTFDETSVEKADVLRHKKILAQLKRIAEHEMAEQFANKNGQNLSNDGIIRKIKQIFSSGEKKGDDLDRMTDIVSDYKNRGIGSVMAPEMRRRFVA